MLTAEQGSPSGRSGGGRVPSSDNAFRSSVPDTSEFHWRRDRRQVDGPTGSGSNWAVAPTNEACPGRRVLADQRCWPLHRHPLDTRIVLYRPRRGPDLWRISRALTTAEDGENAAVHQAVVQT